MLESVDSPVVQPVCVYCGNAVRDTDTFCGSCGREIKNESSPPREDIFDSLKPTLAYYFGTLVLLIIYKHTSAFASGFEGLIAITILVVIIDIGFWIYSASDLAPLFSLSKIKIKPLALTVVGAIAGALAVSVVAGMINFTIRDDVFYNVYLFQDTSYPLLFGILFIGIQPAIFEEVAFRGFLFSNIQKVISPTAVVYVTAFLFGIMHLSPIALLWLVPMGIIFAQLRLKYNTIWYGIVGHFVYNTTITLLDYYGLSF